MTQWHTEHRAQFPRSDETHNASSAAHQVACLLCYRFYRRGMEVEGWKLAGAEEVTAGAGGTHDAHDGSAALCSVCSGGTQICVRMWRDHPVTGDTQRLCVCRDCGHVELMEYRPAHQTARQMGQERKKSVGRVVVSLEQRKPL